MKVLVACEESQEVCKAFRARGFEAYSCDILPCSGGRPEWHIQGDAIAAINSKKWDLILSFPPCTDLAVSGAAWFEKKRLNGEQELSIKFFLDIWKLSNCTENPVGIMSGGKYIKKWFPELYDYALSINFPFKPSQIIEPYYFCDPANKKTCLFIKGLPVLLHDPKNYSAGSTYIQSSSGRRYPDWCWNTGGGSGKLRSKTFPGIAKAMAEQWGDYLLNKTN